MERKNLVVHQGGDGEVVEHPGQTFPHPGVAELPLALVVEAVGLSCLPALVVAPQQSQPGWVPHLQGTTWRQL